MSSADFGQFGRVLVLLHHPDRLHADVEADIFGDYALRKGSFPLLNRRLGERLERNLLRLRVRNRHEGFKLGFLVAGKGNR
jgi:hypothetical protein